MMEALYQMSDKEYSNYLKSREWSIKRKKKLNLAKNRCQVCYSPNNLDVHHRTYVRFKHELMSDLTVLCRRCHALFHKRMKLHKTKGRKTKKQKKSGTKA